MVTVKRVESKADRRRFVDFPNQLYKDNPNFVPATYGDDLSDWDPKANPAFSYCDAQCFLAYRNGEIVGRIGAILSHRANEKWNTSRMRFSQVDFIDDPEVSAALFQAVEDFAREKGCNQVHGPLGFTDLDREGMLVEGYDRRSLFFTYYNAPYYNQHLERLGYHKDTDWIEFRINLPQDGPIPQRIHNIAQWALKTHKLHVAKVRTHLGVAPYVKQVFDLVNIGYAHLYGVVELDEKQIKRYVNKFLPMINMDYTCFVMDESERMVAFGVCAPSMESAFQASRGRLFPTGAFRVLWNMYHNDTLDMFLTAVLPEYQGLGVNAIVMDTLLQGAIRNGIQYAETGPMLEWNDKIHAQFRFFETEQHKRRRCYIKDLPQD